MDNSYSNTILAERKRGAAVYKANRSCCHRPKPSPETLPSSVGWSRKHVRTSGRWTPVEIAQRTTFGHWESDTVLGKKKKGEAAVFTIVERLTGCYFTIDRKSVV